LAGTPLWPTIDGGRVRTAALVKELSRHFPVALIRPVDRTAKDGSEPMAHAPVPEVLFTPSHRAGSARFFSSPRPRVGLSVIDRRTRREVRRLIEGLAPRSVLFAHSYLAAVVTTPPDVADVVDFANVEVERFQSLARAARGHHRASAAWEGLKARRWEPHVARKAALCVAVRRDHEHVLRSWGGEPVLVPNASDVPQDATPSPPNGPVVYVASAGYRPNVEAGARLIRDIWPRVVAHLPDARLQIIGSESDGVYRWAVGRVGVDVVGQVDDVAPYFERAALAVLPVEEGSGTQLKAAQALAHARVLVATPHSAASIPDEPRQQCDVADTSEKFASAVVRLLENVDVRHNREAHLRATRDSLPTWETACRPLVERLRHLVL